MDFGEKPRKRISINITSLVDILIVLLLFFMLTTQFVRMQVLNLSVAGSGNKQAETTTEDKNSITITLPGEGRFIMDGQEFNLLQLKDKIQPLLKDSPNSTFTLLSRHEANIQDVVSAMDYIKSVGGNNISIEEDAADAGEK